MIKAVNQVCEKLDNTLGISVEVLESHGLVIEFSHRV